MTQPRNTDPYSDPRAFYGSELRRLREAAGLTQDQLGRRVFCSAAYIGQFETAIRRPQLELSQLLDDVLGSGEHLQRLCHLARNSKVAEYFADAAEFEQQARMISEYAPVLIPGVLQSEAYARSLIREAQRFAPQQVVDTYVANRMARAQLLDGPTAPVFWAILHETALRVPIGGPEAISEQLAHLATTARSRHNVVLQVLPFAAGAHPFLNTMVSLMHFSDAPPVIYTEGAYSGQLIDDPPLVAKFQSAYDLARAAALSPQASLSLIESAAKDWATHEHRI
ncbi:helix-turn-helix domain-containing protein [Streptomyces rectiverticillatus]|uniref:helix-turn-helix domain-containing protein n=1 Tax=Streptomyces rectiverticillatus TaxID=173860 RepID=UPI001FE8D550|nr:helix-turn-helix transcriptional regulator [Streptomyces rectiverticillatus]QLE74448.1 helix-turn-helix domain-containing protein [Streptomyces rectiverticillatus]